MTESKEERSLRIINQWRKDAKAGKLPPSDPNEMIFIPLKAWLLMNAMADFFEDSPDDTSH